MKLLPKRERIKIIKEMIFLIQKEIAAGLCCAFEDASGFALSTMTELMGFKPPKKLHGRFWWWNPLDKKSRLAYLRKELKKLQPKKP